MDKLKLYLVTIRFHGGGEYVPEDPCVSSGGYYADGVMRSIVSATSKKAIANAVRTGLLGRSLKKLTIELLGPA